MEGDFLLCVLGPQKHGRRAETRASQTAAAEGKISNTCGVGGDARPCLRTPMNYEENERDGGAEIHPEFSQRAAMVLAHVRQQV